MKNIIFILVILAVIALLFYTIEPSNIAKFITRVIKMFF